jgi:hypothetical protein
MIRHTLFFLLGAMLALPGLAEAPKKKADAKAPDKDAAKKELTREELEKLGGFEAAPVDPVVVGPVNLNFDVLMVTLPDALAVPLVESFKDPAKAEATYQKLLGLIEAKKAQVTGWPQLVTKSGNRAVAENIREVRYATEFSPLEAAPPAAVGGAPVPAPEVPKGTPPLEGVLPTTFETRNAGATLELEPALAADRKTIEVNICAQHVRLVGWDNSTVRENGTTKITVPQPRFHTNKVTQNLSVRVGQHLLIGTYRMAEADGLMELFILGNSVTPAAGKEKAKEKEKGR